MRRAPVGVAGSRAAPACPVCSWHRTPTNARDLPSSGVPRVNPGPGSQGVGPDPGTAPDAFRHAPPSDSGGGTGHVRDGAGDHVADVVWAGSPRSATPRVLEVAVVSRGGPPTDARCLRSCPVGDRRCACLRWCGRTWLTFLDCRCRAPRSGNGSCAPPAAEWIVMPSSIPSGSAVSHASNVRRARSRCARAAR
jgi:hypothetical protein